LRDEISGASPKPVLVLFVLIGIALTSVADVRFALEEAVPIASLIFAVSALAFMLDRWKPQIGRWFTIAVMTGIIVLFSQWPIGPGALGLLALPIALAAALLGVTAALVTALAQTVLLALLASDGAGSGNATAILVGLSATWLMAGITFMTYRAMYGLADWAQDYYDQAQLQWDEMHIQRAQYKQVTADLVHVNRQLALTNERLAAARLAAEDAQRAKAAFVANVSHEFRTPLNMIIGLTDLLLETPEVYGGKLPAALLEDLDIVHRNCRHLADMVNDVLDLSQAEAGRMVLIRERVDLRETITSACKLVQPLLDRKDLELRVGIPATLPEVLCDRTRISQVIVNLLSNAARFTDAGSITVQVVEESQDLRITVKDTGPGISDEDAQRIFEPFSQGKGVQRRALDGSGLGLSISKHFVELHGGQMSFDTILGEGSAFHFTIPIAPLPRALAGPGRWLVEDWAWIERAPVADLPIAEPKARVILYDDTGALYPMYARNADGVELVEVEGLAQAVEEARRYPAHALLLNAPTADEMCSLAERARAEIPDTPIIGCCWTTPSNHTLEGTKGYLLKPVGRIELQHAIEDLGIEVRRVLVVDDDPDARRLFTRMLRAYDASLQITTAQGGREALVEMRTHPPDLLLLDIVMPEFDGREVLRHKDSDPQLKDIPVIVLSAQDREGFPVEANMLLATIGQGLSVNQLLRCSQSLSTILLSRDSSPEPARR
jgi:signal transduction histidine kinase/CheY-like chemotaxis protein